MVSFVAQPEVSDIADLRGKTVAVGVPTALSTIFMKEELAANNVAMDDVQTRVIASQPAQLSALLSGQVSATMLSIPQTFVAEERGMKVLKDLGASDKYVWPFAGIVTRSSYAEENREQTVAVLRGIVGGIRAWKENPEAAKEVIRRETKLEDKALVDRSYEAVNEVLEERPIPTEKLARTPLETLAREGNEAAAKADPNRSFDDQYIREALR
jgi:ABC-type nitrate/sulfonate/bicarbonate transport system substrate-binding protein